MVTPSSGLPSTLTWPVIAELRTWVPSKFTTFDSSTATVAEDEVLPKVTSPTSKPEISTE